MIQLLLPKHLVAQATRGHRPAVSMKHLEVHYAKCRHTAWPGGELLMQWKTGEAVDLCLHHFDLWETVHFELHCREDVFIFHFMLEGDATLYFPGIKAPVRLPAGTFNLFLVPAGSHCLMQMSAGRHKSCHAFLKPQDVQLIGSDLDPVGELVEVWRQGSSDIRPGRVCTFISPAILQLLQELEHCDGPEAERYNRVYRGVLHLFSEYRKELTKALHAMSRAQQDREQVLMVHAHILNHYMEDEQVQLRLLAPLAEMSPSRLERLFRQTYGVAVYDFVTQHRIRMACALLVSTHKTVRDIGYAVGYNSPVSFHRVFARICGCTPMSYRMKHRAGL